MYSSLFVSISPEKVGLEYCLEYFTQRTAVFCAAEFQQVLVASRYSPVMACATSKRFTEHISKNINKIIL